MGLSKVIFHYWRRSPDFNWIAQQSGKKKKKKADVVVKEKVVAKKDETQDKEEKVDDVVAKKDETEDKDEQEEKHKIVYEDGDEEIVELSNVIFHYWRRSPDFN